MLITRPQLTKIKKWPNRRDEGITSITGVDPVQSVGRASNKRCFGAVAFRTNFKSKEHAEINGARLIYTGEGIVAN